MAFKRTETAIEPMDLTAATAAVVERRIIDGVRRYATHQDNWTRADKNTPFLGQITGMGIESANLVDITMSIERQFLTRKTKRVPVGTEGSAFRLEDGDLGKLTILEGQDTYAATPGLAVKMLMDLGHMKRDDKYLEDVVSFAYVVVVGEAYRLNETVRKTMRKLGSANEPAARQEILANLKALIDQARGYAEALADPAAVVRARREAYNREREDVAGLETQLAAVSEKLKQVALSDDTGATDKLRAEQTSLRLRLNTNRVRLRVAEEVSKHPGARIPVEEHKVRDVRDLLLGSVAEAGKALDNTAAPVG
jgi:hypothetical protein